MWRHVIYADLVSSRPHLAFHERAEHTLQAPVRIEDILKRPLFATATLIAGSSGISRRVRWVHILDVMDIRSLINGDELVLTTGFGFQNSVEAFQTYLEQLLSAGAAGLCIELGTAIHEIPAGIQRWADAHSFPLIAFPQRVRFVDITQDIHSFLLSRHHKVLDDLESVGRTLQNLTMTAGGVRQITAYIQEVSKCTVVFGRVGQRPLIIGPFAEQLHLDADWIPALDVNLKALSESTTLQLPEAWSTEAKGDLVILTQTVTVLGLVRGVLGFICPGNWIDESHLLLMDKAVNALAQDEFRRLSVQERQSFYEQDFVEELIRGETATPPSWNRVKETSQHLRVAILRTPVLSNIRPDAREEDWYTQRSELAMRVRMALTHHQLSTYLAVRHHEVVAVLTIQNQRTWQKKFYTAMEEFRSAIQRDTKEPTELFAGIGTEVENFSGVAQSYQNALVALRVAEQADSPHRITLYDEAGVHRWTALLSRDERAIGMAHHDLRPIIEYDESHKSHLLDSLKVYLDNDRSVQKTADQLFIHRQTLYHRLELIDRLLALDLNHPAIRLSVHMSLYFHMNQQSPLNF